MYICIYSYIYIYKYIWVCVYINIYVCRGGEVEENDVNL